MSISFSGVGSGLPVSDWIESIMSVERQPVDKLYKTKTSYQTARTTLNTVESKFSSLRSAIEKLTDANLSSTFDLFAKKTASSSDETVATASATSKSAIQNVQLKVESLATSTVAKSFGNIAKNVDLSAKITDLADGEGTVGTFSIYVNGKKSQITLDDDNETEALNIDTLDEVVTELKKISGITDAGIDANGKFFIKTDDTVTDLKFGSNSDTSNFLNAVKLTTVDTASPASKTFSSTSSLSAIKTSGTVVGDSATANLSTKVTAGTFTIGKATFTIDENSTLNDVIAKINNTTDAGVLAQFDPKTNKLVLTSKTAGKTAINLQDGDDDDSTTNSNFLTAMGLIQADGNSITSQTLGNNAKFYLNGSTTVTEAASNTLTGDITGITGVTINLKKVSDAEDDPVTISVNQDSTQLTDALNNFITKFNDVVSSINTNTASTASLSSEYSLQRIKNNLRTQVTTGISGLESYDSLGMIGISTGSVGTSAKETSSQLQFDKSKFLEALADNPSEVKALLIGDKTTGTQGVLQNLESMVESALDPTNGYFAARENSYNSLISDVERNITRSEERLSKRKETLTSQFTAMDQAISQMKSQSSALSF